jgi:BASS family bile acid:Na+ symporter
MARIVPDRGLHVSDLKMAHTLLIAQLLPLLAGLTIHWLHPKLAERIVRPLRAFGNVSLLAVIGLIVATQFDTLAAIRLRGWFGTSLLFLSSLVLGWMCGGRDVAVRKASAITTTARNAAVALMIVNSNFAGTPAVTAVVAYWLVSIVGTLGFCRCLASSQQMNP